MWCHPVDRVQAGDGFLQTQQICRRKVTADVDILSNKGAAVNDAGKTPNYNEVHACVDKLLQQVKKIAAHRCFAFHNIFAVLSAD